MRLPRRTIAQVKRCPRIRTSRWQPARFGSPPLPIGDGFFQRYPDAAPIRTIGTVSTNAKGEFEGAITTSLGAEFVFSAGTPLAQPNFVFTYIAVGGSEQAVYTTGFAVIAR